VAAFILNRMSRVSESNRQQREQFVRLEQLGRDLLLTPPDQPNLPALLERHVPSMFAHTSMEIRLFPDQVLLCHKEDYRGAPQAAWRWLETHAESRVFSTNDLPPWQVSEDESGWALLPILETGSQQVIGGIYLALSRWHPHRSGEVERLLVALQTLAATIASAQARSKAYEQTLAYQRTLQELNLAGQIQQSFLPAVLPGFAGWQINAVLKPAQQASGDFYDVISLPAGQLGLLIADVADKGMGAALFMALARTLLRTYLLDAKTPQETLRATNRRILSDTSSEQFVTAFVAVLDTTTGELVYANAGHNPPMVLSCEQPVFAAFLNRTGIPLGIYEDTAWDEGRVTLEVGQSLVCYTDGMLDAQNPQGEFYGLERLKMTAYAHTGEKAGDIQQALLGDVESFCAGASQFDDITLLVVQRES
jgi:serine phosphatase RsbU (regulator of sigma subunit)